MSNIDVSMPSTTFFSASSTYFFTLSTFGWMNAMSYNIMTQFRYEADKNLHYNFHIINPWKKHIFSGQSKLPTHYHKRRILLYSLYSFGIPALMTLTVGILDKVNMKSSTLANPDVDDNGVIMNSYWRPGIGEESCWLSSCSSGQLLYFYL